MKHLKILFLTIILFFIPITLQAKEEVNLYLFYLSTCPHCANEKIMLNELQKEYSNLNIKMYELTDPTNEAIFAKVKKAFDSQTMNVPFTAIGENYYIGYNNNTKEQIINAVKKYSNQKHCDKAGEALGFTVCEKQEDPTSVEEEPVDEKNPSVVIPILGKVDPKAISLPIVAVVIGTIDGFNPCAMWVLLFLVSMLIGMKDRKRMWALGLTFIGVSALIYLFFMMAWLQVAMSLSQILWIRILISLVALTGGVINIRSYLKSLKKENGCEIVDDKKRTKMFDKIRKFTSEKSFILALLGVSTLAISVNLVELACSAGLPILFTQVLAINNLTALQYFIYILIYILFFLIDDIIVFAIAMKTLQVTGVTTKYSKYSHLIGGILMVIIGILLFFKPEWLMFNF